MLVLPQRDQRQPLNLAQNELEVVGAGGPYGRGIRIVRPSVDLFPSVLK